MIRNVKVDSRTEKTVGISAEILYFWTQWEDFACDLISHKLNGHDCYTFKPCQIQTEKIHSETASCCHLASSPLNIIRTLDSFFSCTHHSFFFFWCVFLVGYSMFVCWFIIRVNKHTYEIMSIGVNILTCQWDVGFIVPCCQRSLVPN